MTQTLSITFHLTLGDGGVDTADGGETRRPDADVRGRGTPWRGRAGAQLSRRRVTSCWSTASAEERLIVFIYLVTGGARNECPPSVNDFPRRLGLV